MIVILEGPDGGGKSTLVEKLADELYLSRFSKVHVTHHGPYPHLKNPSVVYLASLRRRQHQGNQELVILDRSWLSEPIYGEVLRGGKDRVGVASRRMLERVALKCGAMVVNCLPAFEVVSRTWAARKDAELIQVPKHLLEVYKKYCQLEAYTDLGLVDYDYPSGGGLKSVFELARSLAEEKPPATGIGRWAKESILLVGEKVSSHGIPDLPFVSFHNGGCSAWLARQLEEWGVSERDLYWVNSEGLHPDFMGRDDAPQRVVALGGSAAKWCRTAGLEHTQVEHPMYWKRFHSTKPYTTLKEALT